MNTLKFAVNVPARVALSFPTGKPVEGQYGPQVMFSLCLAPAGETSMFLPPIAAAEIQKLGIAKGEPFEICKASVPNGDKPKIEWRVKRFQPEATSVKKPVSTTLVNGHAALNGVPYWEEKTELIRAYDTAIEVLVEARAHAAVAGLPVQFTGEDVRQLAATLIIDRGKNRRTPGLRAA
jgi:hypothetical protein